MNLQNIAVGLISAVNPQLLLNIQVSTGNSLGSSANAFMPQPTYATPGAIEGTISAGVLTVTAQTSGTLQIGQTLADVTGALPPGVQITSQLTGAPGGIGTYTVNPQVAYVGLEAMTTSLVVLGQVQPMTWRDLQQTDGLNLQGTRYTIYVNGRVEGLVRPENRGGDLITLPDGRLFLVAQVLEGWSATAGWTSVAATLQNQ